MTKKRQPLAFIPLTKDDMPFKGIIFRMNASNELRSALAQEQNTALTNELVKKLVAAGWNESVLLRAREMGMKYYPDRNICADLDGTRFCFNSDCE